MACLRKAAFGRLPPRQPLIQIFLVCLQKTFDFIVSLYVLCLGLLSKGLSHPQENIAFKFLDSDVLINGLFIHKNNKYSLRKMR